MLLPQLSTITTILEYFCMSVDHTVFVILKMKIIKNCILQTL